MRFSPTSTSPVSLWRAVRSWSFLHTVCSCSCQISVGFQVRRTTMPVADRSTKQSKQKHYDRARKRVSCLVTTRRREAPAEMEQKWYYPIALGTIQLHVVAGSTRRWCRRRTRTWAKRLTSITIFAPLHGKNCLLREKLLHYWLFSHVKPFPPCALVTLRIVPDNRRFCFSDSHFSSVEVCSVSITVARMGHVTKTRIRQRDKEHRVYSFTYSQK